MNHPPTPQDILAENIRVHDAEASRYDRLHREIFNAHEQRLLEDDLDHIVRWAPLEALDLGPGTGNVTLKLLARGIPVTAVDLSREMLDLLVDRAQGRPLRPVFAAVDEYLEEGHPLPKLITMSSFLHQLPDPMATLESIAQRVPPGGLVYITHEPTDIRPSWAVRALSLVDRLVWNLVHPRLASMGRQIDYRVSDFHAQQGLSPPRILAILASHGFRVSKMRYYGAAKTAALARLSERLGSRAQFAVIACKEDHP